MFEDLRVPIVVAPMAGGPSTPELVAAAARAGAFGFLAGGYVTVDDLVEQIAKTDELTEEPFGVNLFVPGDKSTADTADYVMRVRAEAERYGTEPGTPEYTDDDYAAKLDEVVKAEIPVVSFTFGLPSAEDVRRLHETDATVVVTVTTPAEARDAADVDADVLCVQGFESGGHRGVFLDDGLTAGGGELYGVLSALRLIRAEVDLPLIAAGGLVHGGDVAAVLAAGAVAAQLGTAFLDTKEAGTNPTHRAALADASRNTALTRAFTGRPARGLVNRFVVEQSGHAPAAYPEVHSLTKPVRAAAAKVDDPEAMSMWAGQTYPLATHGVSVAKVISRLRAEAKRALDDALDALFE